MDVILLIILVALVLWAFGLGFNVGFWINVLLVVAVIALIVYIVRNRRPRV